METSRRPLKPPHTHKSSSKVRALFFLSAAKTFLNLNLQLIKALTMHSLNGQQVATLVWLLSKCTFFTFCPIRSMVKASGRSAMTIRLHVWASFSVVWSSSLMQSCPPKKHLGSSLLWRVETCCCWLSLSLIQHPCESRVWLEKHHLVFWINKCLVWSKIKAFNYPLDDLPSLYHGCQLSPKRQTSAFHSL